MVLAPGLWMPGAAMALLAARLSRAGYVPHVFSYHGRSPFEVNVERLSHFARELPDACFIGHSLGGVLVLCKTLGAFVYGAALVLLVRFTRPQLQQVWKLRRVLSGLAEGGSAAAGLELLMDRLKTFRTNDEFLNEIAKSPTM